MVQLVGILNITPDSFSDGGQYIDSKKAVAWAERLFADGAAIVDVGAESTRPNATTLSPDQEWERLEPVLKVLLAKYPGKISLDSYHPETIERAFSIGPVIVNDVTGMNNPAMVEMVVKLKPPKIIISHLPNLSLQEAHRLAPVASVAAVKKDLLEKAKLLLANGITKDQIILDPGIGFGKTMALNKRLLAFGLQVPGYAVMIGYSKKRFLGEHRMERAPNLEAGKIATENVANYLRVHDVKAHRQLLSLNI